MFVPGDKQGVSQKQQKQTYDKTHDEGRELFYTGKAKKAKEPSNRGTKQESDEDVSCCFHNHRLII